MPIPYDYKVLDIYNADKENSLPDLPSVDREDRLPVYDSTDAKLKNAKVKDITACIDPGVVAEKLIESSTSVNAVVNSDRMPFFRGEGDKKALYNISYENLKPLIKGDKGDKGDPTGFGVWDIVEQSAEIATPDYWNQIIHLDLTKTGYVKFSGNDKNLYIDLTITKISVADENRDFRIGLMNRTVGMGEEYIRGCYFKFEERDLIAVYHEDGHYEETHNFGDTWGYYSSTYGIRLSIKIDNEYISFYCSDPRSTDERYSSVWKVKRKLNSEHRYSIYSLMVHNVTESSRYKTPHIFNITYRPFEKGDKGDSVLLFQNDYVKDINYYRSDGSDFRFPISGFNRLPNIEEKFTVFDIETNSYYTFRIYDVNEEIDLVLTEFDSDCSLNDNRYGLGSMKFDLPWQPIKDGFISHETTDFPYDERAPVVVSNESYDYFHFQCKVTLNDFHYEHDFEIGAQMSKNADGLMSGFGYWNRFQQYYNEDLDLGFRFDQEKCNVIVKGEVVGFFNIYSNEISLTMDFDGEFLTTYVGGVDADREKQKFKINTFLWERFHFAARSISRTGHNKIQNISFYGIQARSPSFKLIQSGYNVPESQVEAWAIPGVDAGRWVVQSTKGVVKGDSVGITVHNATKNCDVTVLGTVTNIQSETELFMISAGLMGNKGEKGDQGLAGTISYGSWTPYKTTNLSISTENGIYKATKVSGNDDWDTSLASMTPYANASCGAVVNSDSYTMVGLSLNNTDDSYTSLRYALYMTAGTVQVYEDAQWIVTIGEGYSGDVRFDVSFDGAYVKYYVNSQLVYSHETSSPSDLYFKTCIYRVNTYILSPTFSSAGGNGGGGGGSKYFQYNESTHSLDFMIP
ncbi:MAG: hypothetical protein MJZ11_07970 [Lachnospiraceae bacterium]|nr:hypothetical protein [Lachnospiraceae bacterium]